MNGQSKRLQVLFALGLYLRPKVAIETGTYIGTSTHLFSGLGVKKTFSIEIVEEYASIARNRHQQLIAQGSLEIITGSSVDCLPRILSEIPVDSPILAYLDAHWHEHLPTKQEIWDLIDWGGMFIAIVDDFQVPGYPGYGYDKYGEVTVGPKVVPVHPSISLYVPKESEECETGARRGTGYIIHRDVLKSLPKYFLDDLGLCKLEQDVPNPDTKHTFNNLDKHVVTTRRFIERHKEFQRINADISNYVWRYGPDARHYSSMDTIQEDFPDKVSSDLPWIPPLVCNAISHYNLIEECARGQSLMTIMEDDAVLVRDFDRRAFTAIQSLQDPDFDLIQWGWNWDSFVFIRDHLGQPQKIDWAQNYLKVAPRTFKDADAESKLEPLLLTWGIHCYTLSPKGAQKLLEFYPKIKNIFVDSLDLLGIAYHSETIDGAFNAFYPKLKAYISISPLSYVTNDKQHSTFVKQD